MGDVPLKRKAAGAEPYGRWEETAKGLIEEAMSRQRLSYKEARPETGKVWDC